MVVVVGWQCATAGKVNITTFHTELNMHHATVTAMQQGSIEALIDSPHLQQ